MSDHCHKYKMSVRKVHFGFPHRHETDSRPLLAEAFSLLDPHAESICPKRFNIMTRTIPKNIYILVCVRISAPIICYFESTCHLFFTLTICLHMVIADNSEKRNNQKDLTKHNSFPVFKPAAKYEKLSCYSKTCKGAFWENCILCIIIICIFFYF